MSSAVLEGLSGLVSDEQRRQYQEEGWFVLENVIPQHHLQDLRDECQRFIDEKDAEMDAAGVTVQGLNHKGSRYFLFGAYKSSPKLRRFLFSTVMADVCRATLGDDAFLFLDQYVVKAAEKGMKFSWHQDSGYVGYPHPAYLTTWTTLDDVTEENGTVYLLPYSRQGTRDVVPHVKDPETNDMVGYFGDDPGIPVIAPAGSIACFSSTVFHRSGFNTTSKPRRVYLAQYSPEVIMNREGTQPKFNATQFLSGGAVVTTD